MNKVLVVDDEPDILRLVHDVLTGSGFEVYTANTGERALDLALTLRPDLVILDIVLPGMSGLEVCRLIKRRRDLKMRVLFLTALNRVVDVGLMEAAGADGYMGKPFEIDALLTKVDEMLGENRPESPSGSNNKAAA